MEPNKKVLKKLKTKKNQDAEKKQSSNKVFCCVCFVIFRLMVMDMWMSKLNRCHKHQKSEPMLQLWKLEDEKTCKEYIDMVSQR